MDKNTFIFQSIAGYETDADGMIRESAECHGWMEQPLAEQADRYHDVVVCGHAGPAIADELDACDGEFDANVVAEMLAQELRDREEWAATGAR